MAYGVTHGPPMLDATHAWEPITGDDPPVINDAYDEPRDTLEVILEGIQGWRDLPDLQDNREGKTTGVGEVPYPSQTLGKTLVYEGHIRSIDRMDLLETQNGMVQGFGDMDGEGTMTVTAWAPYGGEEPITPWTYTARVMALKWDPSWTALEDGLTFEWGFTLTLRMSNPYFTYSGEEYL